MSINTPIYKKAVTETQGYSNSHQARDFTGGFKSQKFSLKNGVVSIVESGYSYNGRWYNSPWYEIKFDDGYKLRDFHSAIVYVKQGQRVNNNTLVALEGNTGYVLTYSGGQWRPPTQEELNRGVASHSHIVLYDPQGQLVDPLPYILNSDTPMNNNLGTTQGNKYIVQFGGWDWNVWDEMYKKEIIKQSWEEFKSFFFAYNQTPQGGWKPGHLVIFKAEAQTPTVPQPQPTTDWQKKYNELQVEMQAKLNEFAKQVEDIKTDRNKIISESQKQLAEKDKNLEILQNSYNELKEIADRINIQIPSFDQFINPSIDLISDIVIESEVPKNLIQKWKNKVHQWFPNNLFMQNILSWDIFTILGTLIGAIPANELTYMITTKISFLTDYNQLIFVSISILFGVLTKILRAYFDRNNDGKVDIQDSLVLKEYYGMAKINN